MILNLLFSLILSTAGIIILYKKQFSWKGMNIEMSDNYIYIIIGGGLLFFGLLYLFGTLRSNKKLKKIIDHTICPNCKQTYNYKDLKDGKCLTCKDVDTVEIEQYYKDNPFKKS